MAIGVHLCECFRVLFKSSRYHISVKEPNEDLPFVDHVWCSFHLFYLALRARGGLILTLAHTISVPKFHLPTPLGVFPSQRSVHDPAQDYK